MEEKTSEKDQTSAEELHLFPFLSSSPFRPPTARPEFPRISFHAERRGGGLEREKADRKNCHNISPSPLLVSSPKSRFPFIFFPSPSPSPSSTLPLCLAPAAAAASHFPSAAAAAAAAVVFFVSVRNPTSGHGGTYPAPRRRRRQSHKKGPLLTEQAGFLWVHEIASKREKG